MNFKLKELILIPNLLSVFRLLLVIPAAFLIANDLVVNRGIIILIILLMYLTDISDGFVARKFGMISETGKIIDPVADKIAVGVLFLVLFLNGYVPVWFFIIVILRDVLILTLGAYVEKKHKITLTSNFWGKVTVFSIGLIILLTILDYEFFIRYFTFLYYIVTFLILYSSYLYFVVFKNTITIGEQLNAGHTRNNS